MILRAGRLPYRRCGKIVIAVAAEERVRLDGLTAKAGGNSVGDIRLWTALPSMRWSRPLRRSEACFTFDRDR